MCLHSGSGRWRSFLLIGLLGTALWAGPPFFTDDPEPVELHHMELYLSWMGTRASDGAAGSLPLVEFNEGILPETQLHLVAPLASTLAGRTSDGFNLGAILNLSDRNHVLVSAGRNLSGDRETHLYLGYQLTLDLEPGRAPTLASGPSRP